MERSLPYEREETGRAEFVEACRDLHRDNDAAAREQLHEAGVDFDPQEWLDPMDEMGSEAVRRLYHALQDAGLLRREQRLGYHCPRCRTVLVASESKPARIRIERGYRVRFQLEAPREEPSPLAQGIDTFTFFPEILVGAVAVTVRTGGPYESAAGERALHPLDGRPLPIVAVDDLDADASFLAPAYRGSDERSARQLGLEGFPPIYDDRGRVVWTPEPGAAPRALDRRTARKAILEALGQRATPVDGGWSLDARRCRRCESMVLPMVSDQVFLHLEPSAGALETAIRTGAIRFESETWKKKVEEYLAGLEPLCISRQQWWGQRIPDQPEEVLSTWFSLMAWSLTATGWPRIQEPAPIDEVFVPPDLLFRWIVPSQLVALQLFGRPAFRKIAVHGALHIVDRDLVEIPGTAPDAPDEERFLHRSTLRPMRKQLGNVVEPSTLVRRFGADALRLGSLLCLGTDRPEVVTLSEGALRQARRTLHRLPAQIAGLYRMSEQPGGSPLPEADRALLQKARDAEAAVALAYRELRLAQAGKELISAVDALRSYGRHYAETARSRNTPCAPPKAVLGTVLSHLRETFSPICPYVFSKLDLWAREHGLETSPEAPGQGASAGDRTLEEREAAKEAG